jgi:hypothetical protein
MLKEKRATQRKKYRETCTEKTERVTDIQSQAHTSTEKDAQTYI